MSMVCPLGLKDASYSASPFNLLMKLTNTGAGTSLITVELFVLLFRVVFCSSE
jgi:hypothetical protein